MMWFIGGVFFGTLLGVGVMSVVYMGREVEGDE